MEFPEYHISPTHSSIHASISSRSDKARVCITVPRSNIITTLVFKNKRMGLLKYLVPTAQETQGNRDNYS